MFFIYDMPVRAKGLGGERVEFHCDRLCHDGYLLIIRVVFSLSAAVAALLRIRSTQQRFSFARAPLLLPPSLWFAQDGPRARATHPAEPGQRQRRARFPNRSGGQ